jgi:hypothetical protein
MGLKLQRLKDALIEQWLAWVIALIGGAMLTLAKTFWQQWADPILYGVVGFSAIALVLVGLRAQRAVLRLVPSTRMTKQNAELLIRDWLDKQQWGVKRVEHKDVAFGFTTMLSTGRNITISVLKDWSTIVVQASLRLGEKHNATYSKLPDDKKVSLSRELRMRLSEFKIGFSNLTVPLERFTIVKKLPFTETISEHDVIRAVEEVELAEILAIELISYRLDPLATPEEVIRPLPAPVAPTQSS